MKIGLASGDCLSLPRAVQLHPGLMSWDILVVPAGLVSAAMYTQDLRPRLLSAVPTGLVPIHLDR